MSNHVVDAISVTPPVLVSGLTLWGVTLNDGVLLLTAIYTIVQCGITLYTFIQKLRAKANGS